MAILGPTFEEMLHPATIAPEIRRRAREMKTADPLNPVNLFNINWRDRSSDICHFVMPQELTGVDANIVVLYGKEFPTGSHKVGSAYAVLLEEELLEGLDPGVHTLVWPSTGNFGIGGAYIGGLKGYRSIVVLPEGMSRERFDVIESYGAQIKKTPGSEANVKEIYDETNRLRRNRDARIMNQFALMGNYRFHYHVTGNTIAELARALEERGVGDGTISAFCAAMGSAGTMAAGDRLKQLWPELKIVGLEPVQCPTLYNNGYGSHDIQGIGDKHVTWIHNVLNQDAIMCLDDTECKQGLQLLTDEAGWNVLVKSLGIAPAQVEKMAAIFGISGVCNVLGAIKTAKFYGMGARDTIVTICTDNVARYRSVMAELTQRYGTMDETEAAVRTRIFRGQRTDWIREGDTEARQQWHNLKYYTWVEQQGKSVEELDAQRDPAWWLKHQQMVGEIDARLLAARA